MKNPQLLDLYTDYLLSSFSLVTATGLSEVLDKRYSHDQISRFLAKEQFTQKDFWLSVKPLVREVESVDGILIIDDTIEEKPHSTENELICWHWDHCQQRSVKGINILNFLYHSQSKNDSTVTLPVAFELITKTEEYIDPKTQVKKKKSAQTKNELMVERLRTLYFHNQLKFKYLVWDNWFSSKENMDFVHTELGKKFVSAIKSNRTVAKTQADKLAGKFTKIEELELRPNEPMSIWIKGLEFPMLLLKKVFKNQDGSTKAVFIVTNDIDLTAEQIDKIYQKRWKVEEFHKSLKQNLGLEKSPTKYEVTQSNHVFACMIAYCKLELMQVKSKLNHFAMKAKLYLKAIKTAFAELQILKKPTLLLP